ncbi:MAG: DUF5597 domain-containing protein [Bryobacteraceae bacterium]
MFAFAAIAASAQTTTGAATDIPHLRRQGTATQMIVDGKPFLMLAGELRNSTTSSLEFMKPVWPKLVALHLNTVLAAVQWELLEPKEGQFDFTLVDAQIHAAESDNLRLAFLWFASWKNGASSYPPIWVKGNTDRFPRAKRKDGSSTDTLSTLSAANVEADSRAFAALLRHVKEVDTHRRVILIQVENEVGLLGDTRDRSEAANKAFAEPAPKELLDYMTSHKATLHPEFRKAWEAAGAKTSGTWEDVFGKAPYTDEIFMAWNYARYVGRVAAAGKAQYPVPMFVNTWCSMGDRLPGTYPSGGPEPHVHDLWKVAAPAIDFRSPDLHSTNFSEWADWYHYTKEFPLFIPEAFHATAHYNIFYVMGQHDGIGISPFAIDELFFTLEPGIMEELERRFSPNSVDDLIFTGTPRTRLELPDLPLARSYDIISQLTPLIVENQGKGTMAGAVAIADEPPQKITLGNYVLTVSYARSGRDPVPAPKGAAGAPLAPAPPPAPIKLAERAGVLFIAVGPDEYIAASSGPVNIRFSPNTPGGPLVGIDSIEEGKFVDGRWVPGRRLNGDESDSDKSVRLGGGVIPNGRIQRIKLYRYR